MVVLRQGPEQVVIPICLQCNCNFKNSPFNATVKQVVVLISKCVVLGLGTVYAKPFISECPLPGHVLERNP